MTSIAKRATRNLAGALLITLAATALLTPAVLAADDTQPPTVPTDLRATSVTFTDVALAWNPSTDNVGVDGYRILVDSTWWSYSYQPDSGSAGSLLPGHTYTIAVQAQDHAGNVSPASAPITVSTPADTEPPTAPTVLTSDFAANGVFGLTWVGSTDNADQTNISSTTSMPTAASSTWRVVMRPASTSAWHPGRTHSWFAPATTLATSRRRATRSP